MGNGGEIDDRVAALERRLARLEERLAVPSESERAEAHEPPGAPGAPQAPPPGPIADASGAFARPLEPRGVRPRPHLPDHLASQVLGISGVVAIVLAASYLVRLALDTGWLTPLRQVVIAALAGIGCVVGGLALRASGRRYAALLSAGGIVVLFLTIYGAHLVYGFLGARLAVALVGALCLVALWLGQVFETLAYAFLAMLGAYATPFLVPVEQAGVGELALYYTGWSALFCGHSVVFRTRAVYLVASLLALAGFDLVWRFTGGADWQLAAIYQAGQLVLFTATTAIHSVRLRGPMGPVVARAHAPSLALFYALEFLLLDEHVPQAAPWIGLASVLVVLGAFLAVRARMGKGTAAGELVGGYAALALFHSGYVELVPSAWEPWVGLGVYLGVGAWLAAGGVPRRANRPLLVVGGIVVVLGGLRLVADHRTDEIRLVEALHVAYPLALYAGYFLSRARTAPGLRGVLLYAGHVLALVAVHRLVEGSVLVSVLWGTLAVAALLVAMRRADRLLAQSSLLVFAVSGLKVLTFDLEGSEPLVRIGCLFALGVSLYAGGWLYRRIGERAG